MSDVNTEIEEQKRLTPFELAKNINGKDGFLDVEKTHYDPYIMNAIYSNTVDTVLYANEMNMAYNLPKEMQYAFYYHALPKKKRYGAWNKNNEDKEVLGLIMEYTGFSKERAKTVLPILLPHLDDIRKELSKGGRNKK